MVWHVLFSAWYFSSIAENLYHHHPRRRRGWTGHQHQRHQNVGTVLPLPEA